jgi:hybrid cluster-associated redox disulfide protein
MSVAELLDEHPEAVGTFLRHQMACVGCMMSDFDTLGDAACSYGLILADFMAELEHDLEGARTSRKKRATPTRGGRAHRVRETEGL